MTPIEHLKKLKLEQLQAKHPNVPLHAIPPPKYSDKTANGLTTMVIDWLKLNKHQAERINTQGQARVEYGMKDEVFNRGRPTKITWTKGTGTKGSADVSATVLGYSFKVEVKIGRDRLSNEQRAYMSDVQQAGGIYYVAKDFDSFYAFYYVLIEKLKKVKIQW